MPGSNAELFIEYLDSTFGKEDEILSEPAEDGGPNIAVFVYRECPEPGMITGVTFGLSARNHPDWKLSRPEMVISMESDSLDWPSMAAGLTAYFVGKKRFCYGDVFTTEGPLTCDTEMDGVLIFAQSILDREAATVQLLDYCVTLCQYYPIHSAEIPAYEKLGLEGFWKHPGFGMCDPKRKAIRE